MMTDLHEKFDAVIAPAVERWARRQFGRDDDQVAESVALVWKWCLAIDGRGKDPSRFPGALARFAVRAVRSGRRLVRSLSAKDAMSPVAWRRHSFTVQALPDFEMQSHNLLMEALTDHGQADPADHAAFRLDWPRFLAQQPEKDQRMAECLGVGKQAAKVAQSLKLSPGRVTQRRQALMQRWRVFHGEAA